MVAITSHDTSSSIHRTLQPDGGHGPHLQTNRLEVPGCSSITWQALPHRAASASHTPVHVSPTQPGLPPWGLTPVCLSMPRLPPMTHLGPSCATRFHPSAKVTSSTPGAWSASFPTPNATAMFFTDPESCLSRLGVSFLTVEPHFLFLFCLPCPKPHHPAPC